MNRAVLAATILVAIVAVSLGGPAAGAGWQAPTVVVPGVSGTADILTAYDRLHRAGLAVAIPRRSSLSSLCLPRAGAQTPRAGARVARGTAVTVSPLACRLGSPAGDGQPAVVPDFRGHLASRATSWAATHALYWEVDRAPPLRPSRRARLLDNYVVIRQSPAAGSSLGRGVDCSTGESACFRVTPLRISVRTARG